MGGEGMNPYVHPVWREWIRDANHGGARVLQDLALNLYNGSVWPVDMGWVCGLTDEYAARALLEDYRRNREGNEEFMALCREVAEARAVEGDDSI